MTDPLIQGQEIEITHAFKNSDMGLIPHPFQGNDLTGKTVSCSIPWVRWLSGWRI